MKILKSFESTLELLRVGDGTGLLEWSNASKSHARPRIEKPLFQYNDYHYALVHLFEQNQKYLDFYQRLNKRGIEWFLDNSIFELGEAFDPAKFADWIITTKPTHYIIPDVLNDGEATIASFKDFVIRFGDLPGSKVGVVTGKTWDEYIDCYRFMAEHADYIAHSHYCDIFTEKAIPEVHGAPHWDHCQTKWDCQTVGRQLVFANLIQDAAINQNKPHHLLGCVQPQEFRFYTKNNIWPVRSLDTSNPIMAGINGTRYIPGIGLAEKPTGLLADRIDMKLSGQQWEDVAWNIKCFNGLIA